MAGTALLAGVAAGAAAGLPEAACRRESSLMFLFSSATRSACSCAWRDWATVASLPDGEPPRDSVRRSCAGAAARVSRTCACTPPDALRVAAATRVPPARWATPRR